MEVLYGKGICKLSEIINLGVKHNLIEKAGSWYSINGHKVGQGQDVIKKYLEDNQKVADQIEEQIKHKVANHEIKIEDELQLEDEITPEEE